MTNKPVSLAIGMAIVWMSGAAAAASSVAQPLPAEFACDRVHVEARTVDGNGVRFFTDTGGGTWIAAAAAKRLALEPTRHGEGDDAPSTVAFPGFAADAAIPVVDATVDTRGPAFRGRLFVMPEVPAFLKADGMLGQEWFGGRVWTFDYAAGTLAVGGPGVADGEHTVALGFPLNADGLRSTHFPSIRATVDGEQLPFLLDTGASIRPSAAAAEAIALAGADDGCGTSFISTSVFERWRKNHPDWVVVESADLNVNNEPMIRVPEMEIAGHTVGPVWFTRRADKNFHQFMSSMMDTKVEGALGGSLFRYFRMTIDYPAARAHFERLP